MHRSYENFVINAHINGYNTCSLNGTPTVNMAEYNPPRTAVTPLWGFILVNILGDGPSINWGPHGKYPTSI